jgi:hypothetical protein
MTYVCAIEKAALTSFLRQEVRPFSTKDCMYEHIVQEQTLFLLTITKIIVNFYSVFRNEIFTSILKRANNKIEREFCVRVNEMRHASHFVIFSQRKQNP